MTEVATEWATGQSTLKFSNSILLGFKNTVTKIRRCTTCCGIL